METRVWGTGSIEMYLLGLALRNLRSCKFVKPRKNEGSRDWVSTSSARNHAVEAGSLRGVRRGHHAAVTTRDPTLPRRRTTSSTHHISANPDPVLQRSSSSFETGPRRLHAPENTHPTPPVRVQPDGMLSDTCDAACLPCETDIHPQTPSVIRRFTSGRATPGSGRRHEIMNTRSFAFVWTALQYPLLHPPSSTFARHDAPPRFRINTEQHPLFHIETRKK